MAPERDEDTGQYKEEFPVQVFLNAVNKLETPTTTNVAETVGCSYDLAYRRLNQLADQGKLQKQSVGNSLLWLPAE